MQNPQVKSVAQMQDAQNMALYERNVPSAPLQPYLEVRPVSTKYSYLPIVDPRKELNVPFVQQPTYNVHATFNPGNSQGPWSGFASQINTESVLRNQIYALQKCSQAVYVPSSHSDLYNYTFQPKQTPQAHGLLFQQSQFKCFDPNPDSSKVGFSLFNNSTRSQVKDVKPEPGV
jgi:hypothetical protein